jgi:hypothetical protein
MRRRASVTFVCSATGRSENNRSIHAITALTRAKCLRSGWTINHISRERTGFGPLIGRLQERHPRYGKAAASGPSRYGPRLGLIPSH